MGSERPDSGLQESCVLDTAAATSSKTVTSEISRADAELEIAKIHSKAMAAIESGQKLGRPNKMMAQLRKLKGKPLSANFLEASVAILAMIQTRPTRTVVTMRRLQWRYERDKTPEKFQQFEAKIKSYLGGRTLSNHGFGKASFDELDHGPVWAQLKSRIGLLTEKGYDVFLNSGTLLGVIRDGRLIDHDNDIDLAVVLKGDTLTQAAKEWSDLGRALGKAGKLDPEANQTNAIYKLLPIEGCQIDLFPCWIENGDVFIYPHTFGEMTETELRPLKPCEISGNPIPREPEKMLSINYGEGWKQPDPYFVFRWANAKRRFSEFLERVA